MDSNPIKSASISGYSFSFGIERTVQSNSSDADSAVVPVAPVVQQPMITEASAASQYLSASEMKAMESRGAHLKYGDEQFMKMLDKAFKVLDGRNTSIQFQVHDKTNQLIIKVADRDTGEIIREIPPEKSLDFLAKVQEMLGLIVDVRR